MHHAPLCLGAPAQVRHRGRVARARASASMPPAPPPVLHRLAAPDARASSSDPRRIWDLRESRRSSVRSAAEARSAIARALPSAQYEHGHRRTCPRQGARKLAVVCRAVRWSPASLQQTQSRPCRQWSRPTSRVSRFRRATNPALMARVCRYTLAALATIAGGPALPRAAPRCGGARCGRTACARAAVARG